MSHYSKLLINENPLMVLPSLAVALKSVDAAVVLQQIHYWIADQRAPERDGRRWHYATFDQWLQQFPWMCMRTLKSIVHRLEDQKLIISKEFNRSKGNRTKWYTIDSEEVSRLYAKLPPHSAKVALPSCKTCTTIVQNLHDLYKEEETTKEIIKDITKDMVTGSDHGAQNKKEISQTKMSKSEIDEMFDRFWTIYPNKKGKQKAVVKFFKMFGTLSPSEAEKLMVEIFDGLCNHMLERNLHCRVRDENPSWNVFYADWPHGSTWLNEERWKDSYKTNFEEILNEQGNKNRGRGKSNKDRIAEVFRGTYQDA